MQQNSPIGWNRIRDPKCLCSVLLVAALLCGCGNNRPDTESDAAKTAPSQNPAVPLPTIDETAVSPVSRQSARSQRARDLFTILVSPGLEAEQWDRVHQELVELGSEAAPILAENLQSGTDFERELASTMLALLGTNAEGAVPSLTAALDDRSQFVRANAAAALMQFPDHASAAVPTFMQLLKADDPQLRQMAATNLAAVDPQSIPQVDDLATALTRENPPEVLLPVVQLLGRMGASAEPALSQLQQISHEQPEEVQEAIATAIESITAASSSQD